MERRSSATGDSWSDTVRTHRITPTVATLEEALRSLLARATEGDLLESSLPIDGLELEASGDGFATYRVPLGSDRAITDERHRVALVHPEYDGFLTLSVRACVDLYHVRVVPDEALADCITPQHAIAPLGRGQTRPIDLELHPGAIVAQLTSGVLRIVDEHDADVAPAVRITLGTDASLDCVLAGTCDGPWQDPAALEQAVADVVDGRGSVKRLAKRIEALHKDHDDPGWGRRLWGRR